MGPGGEAGLGRRGALRLKLLRRLLQETLIYREEAETGLVFAEELRWPPGLRWAPNYASVEEHADFARAISSKRMSL